MKKIIALLTLILTIPTVDAAKSIYVSQNGSDANDGSIKKPLKHLELALEQAAKITASGEPATIYLSDGRYNLNNGLSFTNKLKSSAKSPLKIMALPDSKPVLSGSKIIPSASWKSLSKDALKRVHPKVDTSKLIELDLKELGINNIQEFPNSFTTSWSSIDFFVDGVRMPISQFPNPTQKITPKSELGWLTCNGSKDECSFYYAEGGKPKDGISTNELDVDGTNRSLRWSNSIKAGHDLWLKGNFRVPWDPVSIKVKEINTDQKWIRFVEQPEGGMGSKYTAAVPDSKPVYRYGSGEETYFALNYLDEIDEPGEWAIDFKDAKLYFYPKSDIGKSEVMISDNKQPLLLFKDCSNITIEGVALDGNLGNGIEFQNASNITISGCDIRNISGNAIQMQQSKSISILSNDIKNTGSFGIYVEKCGNLAKIIDADIVIDNNHIYDMGKLAFNGGIGLMECCGVKISHNLIHDSPKNGIENRNSINILMEYNEMHNFALKSGDTGAVYSYGGWYTYGNVLRYNFVHHNVRTNGFYPDDGDCGDVMYGNIIQGCITAFMMGGGHDNLVYNNLVIDCDRVSFDNRGIARNYRLGTKYEKDLMRYKPQEGVWKEYGERLNKEFGFKTKLWEEVLKPEYEPERPRNSKFTDNILVKVGKVYFAEQGKSIEVAGNENLKTITEAQFADYSKLDLRTQNRFILAKMPDFNTIYPKIGLYKNNFRKFIPSREETGGLKNRLEKEGDKEDQLIFKK